MLDWLRRLFGKPPRVPRLPNDKSPRGVVLNHAAPGSLVQQSC